LLDVRDAIGSAVPPARKIPDRGQYSPASFSARISNMRLKRMLLIIALAAIVLAFLIYRSRQASKNLDVEPHAREEIEKAKRR
jgi:hypothetical protein